MIIPREEQDEEEMDEDDEYGEDKYIYLPNTDIYKEEHMIGQVDNHTRGVRKSTLIQQSTDGRI